MRMNLWMALAFGVVAVCLAPSGRTAEPASTKLAEPTEAEWEAWEGGGRTFAIDLYREVAKTQKGSFVVSPLSTRATLALLHQGANGETAKQIGIAGRFPNDPAKVARLIAATRSRLADRNRFPQTTVTLATGAWPCRGLELHEDFRRRVETDFGATVEELDFEADPTDAAKRINVWAAQQTRGLIPRIVPGVDKNCQLVVASAVYLQTRWWNEFPKQETTLQPFRRVDGTIKSINSMLSRGTYGWYVEDTDHTFICLPTSDQALVTLAVPRGPIEAQNGLGDPSALVNVSLNHLRGVRWDLRLPWFEARLDADLMGPLRSMGWRGLGTRMEDFTGFASRPLVLSSIRQNAIAKADEEGVVASAVTSARFRRISAGPTEEVAISIDRPFSFKIEAPAGELIMIGRFMGE